MTALDHAIERFTFAHIAELSATDVVMLGQAAGIIRRVHAAPAYLPPPVELDGRDWVPMEEDPEDGR